MNSRTKILVNKKATFGNLLLMILFLTVSGPALASTTWYVNGVSGSDKNHCMSPATACKTIGHAISLARPGDSVSVAAATYRENLIISVSLTLNGSGALTTIVDGGGTGAVVNIPNSATHVSLANLTIRNGRGHLGGGIYNNGTLTINNSTISGNVAEMPPQCHFRPRCFPSIGGGIAGATLTISNTTISGNSAHYAGGISGRTLTISNATISGNDGGIRGSTLTISNTTISGNGVGIIDFATVKIQNSILANISNCPGPATSNGYNLSSDNTCNFSNSGDQNNIDPKLATLGYHGGPTQTIPLLSGSPAIDGGNPSGCTDGSGHLLKTDQREQPRPNTEDKTGCDIGAYERQND